MISKHLRDPQKTIHIRNARYDGFNATLCELFDTQNSAALWESDDLKPSRAKRPNCLACIAAESCHSAKV